jgi:hypothetical protein
MARVIMKKLPRIFVFMSIITIYILTGSQTMANDNQTLHSQGADVTATDFIKQINNIGDVKEVTLIFVVPRSEHAWMLSEAELKKGGHKYVTQNLDYISNMLNILKSANIQTKSKAGKSFEPTEAVYLTLANDKEVKFLFNYPFPGEDILMGSFNEIPITANPSLPEALFKWAARLPINTKSEAFIKKYRNQ